MIAGRLVSCKVTCYHVTYEKNSLHFVSSLQSALCADRIGIAVFFRASLKSRPKYWSSNKNFSEIILAAMIDVWIVC